MDLFIPRGGGKGRSSIMTSDVVKRGYDKVAESYLAERDRFKNSEHLDRLTALLSPRSTILDIGCGAGIPIDRYLISKGHKVAGIDISEKQIELAKRYVPEGDYKVADMLELREGEYSVDAVVSFYAIFHIPREKHPTILRAVHSFLKPGGYMLITMGASEWEGTEDDFFGGEMYWSHYDRRKNRELVENTGLTVLLDEIDSAGGEAHQVLLARKS